MKNYILIGIIGVLIISGYFVYQNISKTSTTKIQPEDQTQPDETNCAKKGEYINSPAGTNKNLPDVCCSGLKGLGAFSINENGECERIKGGPFLTCMPCGNGVCESDTIDENKCNCPEDCQPMTEKLCEEQGGNWGEMEILRDEGHDWIYQCECPNNGPWVREGTTESCK